MRRHPVTPSRSGEPEAPTAVEAEGRAEAGPDRAALERLLEPVVSALGYELVTLELASERGGRILRLYIDTVPASFPVPEGRAPGEVGVNVDDCALVSRRVGAVLDERVEAGVDPLPGAYRLEVSSPGLFRPLAKRAHFEGARGERVRVVAREKIDGRRVFVGRLVAVDGSGEDAVVVVAVAEGERAVPLTEVAKANLEPVLD